MSADLTQDVRSTEVLAALSGGVPGPPLANAGPDSPRSVNPRSLDDMSSLFGAAIASLAVVWVLYSNIFPTSGKVGFVVLWYGFFIGFYALVTRLNHPRPVVVDKVSAALVTGGAFIVVGAVVWAIAFVLIKGWAPLHHANFYSQSQSKAGPTSPLTQGGIYNAVIGSVIELTIATIISVPAGIGCAIYMTEVGGKLSKVVRTVVEAMTALPDLVAGLFVYYFLIVLLAKFHWASQSIANKDGLSAAIALSITMLPIIARSSEVTLRVVPSGLREAGLALGSSQWSTVRRVVLPTARPGLATAVILGMARAVGETAPLLIVSAATTFTQYNPVGQPMSSLPLAAYNYIRFGATSQAISRGYGAAAVLLIIVTILFVVIRVLSRQRSGTR